MAREGAGGGCGWVGDCEEEGSERGAGRGCGLRFLMDGKGWDGGGAGFLVHMYASIVPEVLYCTDTSSIS